MRQTTLQPVDTLTQKGDTSDAHVAALIRLVGGRVRAARKAAQISRRELSERSGVSPRYLAQLEGEEGNISLAILKRIALALDLPVEAFLQSDDPLETEAARIAALYRAADPATRAQVLAVLDPAAQRAEKAERMCLIGLRGAGKSTLGALIAADFKMPFVELNKEIEKDAGIPVTEIFALYGDEGYRQLEAETLDRIVSQHTRLVLAVAGGIVASDAAFAKVLALFHTIWLKADPAEHMHRVRAQGDLRPMAGNPQAMVQLHEILNSRAAKYAQAAFQLDTSGRSASESHADLRALVLANHLAVPEGD